MMLIAEAHRIDEFVVTFTRYIDSGFGLLGSEVHYLTAILIGIDITLAGLYWAMGSDSSVIGKFLKKVMYVGVFALIITNFSSLANVIFNSFGFIAARFHRQYRLYGRLSHSRPNR